MSKRKTKNEKLVETKRLFQMIFIYTTREKETKKKQLNEIIISKRRKKTKASGNIGSIDVVHHHGSFFDIQIIVDRIH
jgi:hypothetical protein